MRYSGMACVHVDPDSDEQLCPSCNAMLERMPRPELQIVPVSDTVPQRPRVPIEIIDAILPDLSDDDETDDDFVPPRLN